MAAAKFLRILSNAIGWSTASASLTNATLDANNDGVAYCFQAQGGEAITHIGFRYAQRVGTPPTYVATLEGVNASDGKPDGTDVGGGSPTAATFTPPADATWDAKFTWVQLTNAYTPTPGQMLCFTIRYSSGTVDGSNHSLFTVQDSSANYNSGLPYRLILTAGTWGAIPSGAATIGAIRTATTRYGYPYETLIATRGSTTVGNRQAMYFTIPNTWFSTFKVVGFRGNISPAAAVGKAPLIGIWDSSGAVQGMTKALDSDQFGNPTSSTSDITCYFDDTTLPTLNAGTEYYIGFQSADATNGGAAIRCFQLTSADDKLCFPLGTDLGMAAWDGATWTKETTRNERPQMELILSDITAPSGGGGGGPLVGGRLVI